MGLDFLLKTAKPFERSCQKGFESLTAAYLFDPIVGPTVRSFVAELRSGVDVDEGQELVLRYEMGRIGLYLQEREIGSCPNPPAPVVEKMGRSYGGLAVGRLDAVHRRSRSADVVVL